MVVVELSVFSWVTLAGQHVFVFSTLSLSLIWPNLCGLR